MLETHRTDTAIVESLRRLRCGGTVEDIHAEIGRAAVDPISLDTIKRHLPGLVTLGIVERGAGIRNDRPVFIWRKSGDCVPKAENAQKCS